jgi:uncharacterized membrane protein
MFVFIALVLIVNDSHRTLQSACMPVLLYFSEYEFTILFDVFVVVQTVFDLVLRVHDANGHRPLRPRQEDFQRAVTRI